MKKYDYIDRVLYMAILSQECTVGDGKVASGIWELTKLLFEKKKRKPLEKSSGANK